MQESLGEKRKRELSSEDLQRFLARLDADSERASAEYKRLKDRLARFCFRNRENVRAEELADGALDVIARRTDLETIQDVEQFAVGVVRNLLITHRRSKSSQQAPDDPYTIVGDLDPEQDIVARLDRQRKEHCFMTCLKNLPDSDRRLVLEYYPNENRDLEKRRKQLAASLGIESGALATRMNRLRSRLERCCWGCYKRSVAGQIRQAS